ncbi:MAG: arginine decarboxylase [Lentisphaeria bacterium]|nr:arginine decarboxylase [Lentisphaeria bacterium]
MNRELEQRKVLLLEELSSGNCGNAFAVILKKLRRALKEKFIHTQTVQQYQDALILAETDMDLDAFLIQIPENHDNTHLEKLLHLLHTIRKFEKHVPIFLLAMGEEDPAKLSMQIMENTSETLFLFEESSVFAAGRIESAIRKYRENLLPPLMKAIWKYNEEFHEYSWAAPGHQGGVGFTKDPVGKKFYDFYGENLFRTDTGIERSSIGSLLDHEGAFGESEKYAAKVFGAHYSFSAVVGSSGSNRTIMQSILSTGDVALCDRNCHKSIEQGLILSGAKPVYMLPARNCYGIIGPVPVREMDEKLIRERISKSPLIPDKKSPVSYAVLTNCTYDGLCYNAVRAEEMLGKMSDVIHFDEAWYAYARFNSMYEGHFAMHGAPEDHRGATVFATHSTHKLLNALSQASYIHIREGRKKLDPFRFNQAYMMHSTTSPLYAISASNDISSAMMDRSGDVLIKEVIAEAVDFRQAVARLHRELTESGSWFFRIWNSEKIFEPVRKGSMNFADAPRELLINDQNAWKLTSEDPWHGFDGIDNNWAMLDPIKVSILTPGMERNGVFSSHGIPAALVAAFLYREGIVPTRTTDFQLMFLFSMGITKGKWRTLLNCLLNFRKAYENDVYLRDILPELCEQYPALYGKCTIKALCMRMFDFIVKENPQKHLDEAFRTLPEQEYCPRYSYEQIVKGKVEIVSSDNLAGRTAANSVIPYPPGIPMLMSGEKFDGTKASPGAQVKYLQALEKWDEAFPGFEHVIEGAIKQKGKYCVLCLVPEAE